MSLMRVMLLASAVALAACGGSDGDTTDNAPATVAPTATADTADTAAPATTSEVAVPETAPTATAGSDDDVFSWTDDLCQWVTGDEVVEFLTAAGADVEGPATASEPWTDDATGWNCGWTLASGDEIQLGAESTTRLSSMEELNMVTEYTEPGQVMQPGEVVSGHPNLSQGVVVENQAFGRFGFYTPTTDAQLNLHFNGDWDSDTYEAVVMGTADAVLDELGWLPT